MAYPRGHAKACALASGLGSGMERVALGIEQGVRRTPVLGVDPSALAWGRLNIGVFAAFSCANFLPMTPQLPYFCSE